MKPMPRRPGFLLKLFAFAVPVVAAFLSVAGSQQPAPAPAAAAPEPPRAIGAMHPRLAPDGKDIVFSYQGAIWRVPSAGGVMRRLTAGPGFAFEPCWSPDGKHIAFLQGQAWGNGTVKRIEADTGKEVPLKTAVVGRGKIGFSADGKLLLGNLRGDKQPDAFRSLDLATGELKTVLRQKTPRQAWGLSADGQALAWVTPMDQPDQQGGNDGPEVDVWKVPAAGGEPEKLFRFPARIHDVCWASDGRALFISTEVGGASNDLYRIDLANPERPIKLTSGQADEDRPSLSADGRRLTYVDNNAGCSALMVRDLDGAEPRSVPIRGLDFGAPTGRLELKVTDKGQPAAARVSIENKAGGSHAPPGAVWRTYREQGFFYVDKNTALDVPAGSYRVRAVQGPETRPVVVDVEVPAGKVVEQAVALDRWADPNAKGWYSGDNHIHANYGYGEYYHTPATMALMGAGEGLNVMNLLVANSDGNGVFDRQFFRGQPDPHSTPRTILYWNEEFRSTIWGHMTLINLKHVVEPIYTGFSRTTNPYDVPTNAGISDRTRRQGGLVNYTHPSARIDDLYRGAYTAKGLPLDVAVGKVDTMDVMGTNQEACVALYHRLLNCGFKLTASAGTDCFLNHVTGYSYVPGVQRVYVKVDGPLTYAGWIAGLRAGRSFVTNGPILEFTVDGKNLGETIELKASGTVKLQATAASQHPLTRVEVLYNGEPVTTVTPAKDALTTELARMVKIEQSGWLALRVVGPVQPDTRGDQVLAHTSPVYVVVAGRPAGREADAKFFVDWIDQLAVTVQERGKLPDEAAKAEVEALFRQGRAVYERMLDRGPKK